MEDSNRENNAQTEQRFDQTGQLQSSINNGEPEKVVSYQNSVVEYFGASSNYCGYCKRDESETESGGRKSYDIKAHVLRASDYQKMLDKGWRRSGNYCYCPINSLSCCPNYPLSCEALNFRLSKSQRRCIENLNSFLVNGSVRDRLKLDYETGLCEGGDSKLLPSLDLKSFETLKNSPKARDKRFVASCERKVKLYNITIDEAIARTEQRNAKRRQQRTGNLENYLYPKASTQNKPISALETKHKLKIKMHYVDSKDSRDLRNEENQLIQRYQKAVHKENSSEWTMNRYHDFLINSPIVVEPIQQDDGTDNIDGDTLTIPNQTSDYLLVKPPDLPTAYGTYHCVYFLDEKMIAVGVLDVLPKCITTVYFFYEPEFGYLNLGTYSALVEISMVRQMYELHSNPSRPLQNSCKLIYYYLGFYVHECKKMHYKTKFHPSHLLCSETHRYVPTEDCLKLLKDKKYARFYQSDSTNNENPNNDLSDLNEFSILDIPVVTPVTSSAKMIDYFNWLEINYGEEYVRILVQNILLTYVGLIGPDLVSKISLRLFSIHRALADRYRKRTNHSSKPKTITA